MQRRKFAQNRKSFTFGIARSAKAGPGTSEISVVIAGMRDGFPSARANPIEKPVESHGVQRAGARDAECAVRCHKALFRNDATPRGHKVAEDSDLRGADQSGVGSRANGPHWLKWDSEPDERHMHAPRVEAAEAPVETCACAYGCRRGLCERRARSRRGPSHERSAGQNARIVKFDDSAINPRALAKVVNVDGEAGHRCNADTHPVWALSLVRQPLIKAMNSHNRRRSSFARVAWAELSMAAK